VDGLVEAVGRSATAVFWARLDDEDPSVTASMERRALTRRALGRSGGGALLTALMARLASAAETDAAPTAAPGATAGNGQGRPFSFERLIERTRQLAAEGYQAPPRVPDELGQIPIDVYERVAFKPEALVWADSPSYRLGFFLPGSSYREPVMVSIVEDGLARPVQMRADMFDLSAVEQRDQVQDDMGFAGLRVLYPLDQPTVFPELVSFLGASYFRAIGRGTNYGAGARGLALNTGLGRAEEFPGFRHFWVQRPGQPFDPLTIYALLDSPSVAGAFRFDITVRESTRMAVDAILFFRSDVEQVGIAPLSSMFLFGPNDQADVPDFRPEVHSSGGLAMWNGAGELLYRTLVNPSELRMSIFVDESPRGFGLVQRNRRPEAYQDIQARFDLRPNLWVEPRGTWGKGSIRLIEVPTQNPQHQNLAAFWTPAEPVRAGQELRLAYTLVWSLAAPIDTGLATVTATRIGIARNRDGSVRDNAREVVIDWQPATGEDAVEIDQLNAALSSGNSKVSPPVLVRNPIDNGWRLTFQVEPSGGGPVELRAVLRAGDKLVSETWLYRLDQS
jgi:glucans biosynthesis protein